jgi:hypothetical protein
MRRRFGVFTADADWAKAAQCPGAPGAKEVKMPLDKTEQHVALSPVDDDGFRGPGRAWPCACRAAATGR